MDSLIRATHSAGRLSGRAVVVVQGDDVVFQDREQGILVLFVLVLGRHVFHILPDGPTVLAVVPFAPPSVQHGKVQGAVDGGFLAGGSRGFERPQRRVQPDVHALDEVAGQVDVVILQEHQPPAGIVTFREPVHLLEQPLGRLIGRMGFARRR